MEFPVSSVAVYVIIYVFGVVVSIGKPVVVSVGLSSVLSSIVTPPSV